VSGNCWLSACSTSLWVPAGPQRTWRMVNISWNSPEWEVVSEKLKGAIWGGEMTVAKRFAGLNGVSATWNRGKYKCFDNGWRKTNTDSRKLVLNGKVYSGWCEYHYGRFNIFRKGFRAEKAKKKLSSCDIRITLHTLCVRLDCVMIRLCYDQTVWDLLAAGREFEFYFGGQGNTFTFL
jgi:hypothetical protein